MRLDLPDEIEAWRGLAKTKVNDLRTRDSIFQHTEHAHSQNMRPKYRDLLRYFAEQLPLEAKIRGSNPLGRAI